MLDTAFIESEVPHTIAFDNAVKLKTKIDEELKKSGAKVLLLMSSGTIGGEVFY